MPSVLYKVEAGVATISLNRPERLNAINLDLIEGLNVALDRAAGDANADVILLTGEGRAFCAGDDLVEFAQMAGEKSLAEGMINDLQGVTRRIMLGEKPVVCAARGWAVGGGASWLINADFLILADDAVIFCPEAAYGLFPTGGMTVLLNDRCGAERAARVLWLGERLTATHMYELGFTKDIFPANEIATHAIEIARRLADLPPVSRQRYKKARAAAIAPRLEQAMAFEAQCCLEASHDPRVRRLIAETSGVRML